MFDTTERSGLEMAGSSGTPDETDGTMIEIFRTIWSMRARTLAEVLIDRRNNFDLIRFVAACLVIWAHVRLFEAPDTLADPFPWLFSDQQNNGEVAVGAFFLISGILIPASLERHRSFVAFVVGRYARLMPGLVAFTAVAAFIVAPLVSGYAIGDRAGRREALACLRTTLKLPFGVGCSGVSSAFPASSVPGDFAFPLWTLPVEIHLYGLVLLIGIVLRKQLTTTVASRIAYLALTAMSVVVFLFCRDAPWSKNTMFERDLTLLGDYTTYPALVFMVGMTLYGLREWIWIDRRLALVTLVLSLALPFYPWLVDPASVYAVLALADVEVLRRFRPRHDLSFGIYLYGALCEQVAYSITGPGHSLAHVAIATPLAIGCGWLSSLLVERPAMSVGRVIISLWSAVCARVTQLRSSLSLAPAE